MILVLLVAAGSFGIGVLTAALCFSAREGDLVGDYEEALAEWRRILS